MARSEKLGRALVPGAALLLSLHVFWMLALPRPYGMLVHPEVTERMATAATVAASGDPSQTCFARDPNRNAIRDRIVGRLAPSLEAMNWLFRLVPAAVTPLIALALYAFSPGETAFAASVMLLFFWSAGEQLLPPLNLQPPASLWGDPWGAAGLAILVVGVSMAGENLRGVRLIASVL
ncbi:MAG: hypothetical protein L0191_19720, partial [Acidobacteria bacterium]|nr:hypothetical protein [Acidobacteriota bacterium]